MTLAGKSEYEVLVLPIGYCFSAFDLLVLVLSSVAGLKEQGLSLLTPVCTTQRNRGYFMPKREDRYLLLSSYSWVLKHILILIEPN